MAAGAVTGAVAAGIIGFLIGMPVLRLRGDYLAIVTLAFGEIIKSIINVGKCHKFIFGNVNTDGFCYLYHLCTSETVAQLREEEVDSPSRTSVAAVRDTALSTFSFFGKRQYYVRYLSVMCS